MGLTYVIKNEQASIDFYDLWDTKLKPEVHLSMMATALSGQRKVWSAAARLCDDPMPEFREKFGYPILAYK